MRGVSAAGAREALRALHEAAAAGDPFPITLLDLNLAGESGLDLAREIAQADELRDTRLILLTSSAARGSQDPALRISRRLSKPVRKVRLLTAITEAMAVGEGDGAAERRRIAVPADRAPAGARILVAEDHEVNWMLIERMLQNRGHRVAHARDGDEVIEMVLGDSFDLVLMDCQMPVRDGYDTARELRRLERVAGDGRHLPVVAMTATAMPGTRERCLAAGMDDYVAKPVSTAELDELLRRWLGGSEADGRDEAGAGARNGAGWGEGAASGDPGAEELDPARLDELGRLFPGDAILEVLQEMEDEVGRDLADLQAGMSVRDQAGVAAAAHRIRNTGRLIGAGALVDAAARLDHPPRDGQPPVELDGGAFEEVQHRWVGTRAALEALRVALADGRPA
jgi:CheY-like chemotaxis protein